jgi:uncharacterized protein (DUF2236 family)
VLWVHLTLLDSLPRVYELLVAPLSAADRDAYCAEAAWAAIALGARAADVPRTWMDVQHEISRMYGSGAIIVGPHAQQLGRSIVSPEIGYAAPPLMWLNRLITVGTLPPTLRQQYSFRWSPRQQRLLERTVPVVRAVRGGLPERLALWADARG